MKWHRAQIRNVDNRLGSETDIQKRNFQENFNLSWIRLIGLQAPGSRNWHTKLQSTQQGEQGIRKPDKI